MTPAGFWRRVVSFLIDMALSAPIFYLCMQLSGGVQQQIAFTVIVLALYTVFLSSQWRATPGMRLTKIEAYGADGNPLTKAHALYWCIASSVFAFMAFAPILYVQYWAERYDLEMLFAAVNSHQLSYEEFSMELQVRTGMNAVEMSGMFTLCLLTSAILCLIWALSVVLSKKKVGWHNWLSATRFVVRAS